MNLIMSGLSSVILFVCIFGMLTIYNIDQAEAQAQSHATTDPHEETVLNSIFQQWGLSASQQQWNISGEPCSGAAINSSIPWDNEAYNPFIKCLCSFNNDTLCHITVLKVKALNVVGAIPDELWTLTFLKILDLGLNYLTGNISASIKNLTQLEGLYLNANAFSGNLPVELGELKNLTSMSFAENNFSGSLPYMIGTLSKLRQLYFSSSGVTGAIPSSFAWLQNMETLWASDNDLTGRIPEFIGLWKKLIDLRLQGNSFEGPIPSTFSNLTLMQELRISDLSNGSSSLVFIKDMKSLNILVLRNCHISGVIPSNIREYRNLTLLDLSFNNISGEIPGSLFGSSSLVNLLLGNNKITGFLPLQKSSSIMNIDLSYNNLSGTALPSWVEEKELQLNLAANYFNIESLNSSVLPRGLHCLQRTFSCNQNSVLYKNFSINSGGPQFTSSNGIVFEGDNESLGPATYFVADTYRWAVSNVGFFASDYQYTCSTSSVITNTFDSELYQTSRISASSLRYYGLGLENGKYNVTLLFAETAFPDTRTWQNHGRRVFDIYIQGNLVQKDFDIKKMAGGTSFRAYQIEFNVQVMQNYLEIHLYWAGKGTCCIPNRDTYGPAISAITAAPVDTVSISHKNPQIGLIVGTVLGSVAFFLFVLAAALYVIRGRKRPHTNEDIGLNGIDAKPYIFSYDELRTATEDFNPSNKLGEGGFGPVFKATLSDGEVVAVKQLSVTSRQGKVQFAAEIAIISSVQHRNLVKLHGCCINGDKRLVVYEYLENKSLDQALFGKRNLDLNWPARFNICLGVAKGLAYLHEESRHRIVHRDIKAGNILLDSNLDPKISDFGLAKLYDNHKTHISTCVAGTFGYLAPEYALFGHLTEKVDVFSFGVLLLEIISGRPNTCSDLEEDNVYLLNWAWQLHENNCDIELMDSRLTEFNEEEAKRVIGVAFLCTQAALMLRPLMSHVVAMLLGDIEVTLVTSKPAYLTDWNFNDMSNFMSENRSENCTSATSYMLAGEEQSSSTIHMVGTDKTSSEGTVNTKRPEIIEESG